MLALATLPQLVFYDIDAQTESDGSRLYEYISVSSAEITSIFSEDTVLIGGVELSNESHFALNSNGVDAPFPSSAGSPSSDAIKYISSFHLPGQSSWSTTFSARARPPLPLPAARLCCLVVASLCPATDAPVRHTLATPLLCFMSQAAFLPSATSRRAPTVSQCSRSFRRFANRRTWRERSRRHRS